MKKQLFSLLCFLMLCVGTQAQTNIANYTFSKSMGTYVPLTGATTFTNTWDNLVSGAIPLGGNFTFGGTVYTSCFISSNGYITFGGAPTTTNYTPMSTLGAATGAIAGYGQDANSSTVAGASPSISYANIGGATGEFVVQYQDHSNFFNRTVERLNFQIRLNLATGAINIVYGSWTAPGTVSASGTTAHVGIRGNTVTQADNVNSLMIDNIPAGTTCTWADAVTAYANTSSMLFASANTTVVPSNGLTFSWAPPAVSIAPVRVFSAVTATTQTSANMAWTAAAGATQYNIQYRIPGTCSWTNFSGNPVTTNSVSITGLTASTVYQVRVQSSDGTNNAIWSHIPSAPGTGNGYATTGTFRTLDPPCMTPTAQPTGLTFGGVTNTVVNGTITPITSATTPSYLVIRTLGTAPNTPTNGTTYTTGASAALAGTVVAVTTNSTFATTGLVGNTNYSYYIYAYTSTNCTGGPLYNVVAPLTGTVTTCPAKPATVTNTLVTSTSFNLNWTASVGGTAAPITYSVEVSSNSGFTAPVAGSPFLVPAPTTSLALSGLNASTTYYYRITTDNGCNIGATTSASTITAALPTDLQALQVVTPAINNSGCYGTVPVVIQIKNAGSSVLDFNTNNATVIASVSGPNPQSYTTSVTTGTLAVNATQDVTLTATYNMSALGSYTIDAIATLATPDANTSNNAIPSAIRTNSTTAIPIVNPFTAFNGTNLATIFPLWSEGTGTLVPSGTTSAWANQTGLNGTGNITAKINLYTTTRNEWILTPKFVVAPSVNMTFDAAVTDFGATTADAVGMNGTDDKVEVLISADCGASFTSLLTVGQSYSLTPAFKSFSVSLASYVGQEVIIGFKATDGPTDDLNDYDFHIDNVNLITCFPPSALTASNTTISSVDLSWTAAPFGNPNYVYEIRTSGAAGSGATGLVTTGTVTAPSTSVTATGLSITTSYSVYVRSYCGGSDFSAWTPVKTFTTPAACPATSTPTVTNITGYTAVATWTVGGAETMWDIYYGPSPLTAPTATTAPTTTVSGTPSYTIAALTPTTGYAVYVRANCGVGNTSAWSAIRSFTTTVSCPAPTSLTLTTINPTSAVAAWIAGGAETNWFVKYSAPTTTVIASGAPSYTMAGLTPSTSYSIQVRAICGAGDTSAYTTVRTFMTPCLPPNITGTIPGSRCGIGTVTLGATADPGANIQWYTAPTGGVAVATGSVYTTPTINNTTNFYVTAGSGASSYTVGSPSTTGAQGTNTGGYLIFDAFTSFNLNSVTIYPGGSGAGTVVIALQNSAGTTLQTATIACTGAATAIPQLATLNFAITPGTAYRLTFLSYSGGVTSMYRELTGTVYPFTVPGVVSITSTSLGSGYYYFFYNWQLSTGCESARTAVTATVTAPPALSVTSAATVCANVISTVSVTSTVASYDSYVWSPVTNLYTDAAATIPYAGGTATAVYYKSGVVNSTVYTVNASNSGSGCANTATTTLRTTIPVINASLSPTVVCSGAAVTLSATTNANTTGNKTVGTNSLADYIGGPYREGAATDNKAQWLITAAELTAAGFAPGNITGLGFNVTTLGSGSMNNFTIRMGTTASTALGATYEPAPATIVYGPVAYSTVAGANNHVFSTPFNWDGVSNVLIQVCHDALSGTSTYVSRQSISNRTAYTNAAGACASAAGTTVAYRPVMTFTGQVAGQGAGAYTWQWNPGALNGNTVTVNPVNTGTTATTVTYTVTGTDPMTTCTNTAAVTVTVNAVPATPTAANSTQCGVGIPTASVSAASGGTSYNWYATPISTLVIQSGASQTYTSSISSTTNFYVSSFNGNCESPRTLLTASVTTPDAVTAASSATAICPGQSFILTATNTGTNNVYSYTWTATPAAGSGIATSVSGRTVSVLPGAPGNYNYLVTAVDGVCTATASVNVLTNTPPTIVATASPSVMCSGSTATLNAVTSAVSSGTATVGTMSTVNFIGGPYRGGSALDDKAQWLFTAAELNAAGIFAGNITSISFNNTTTGSVALANFTLRMGTTTSTSLSGVYDAAPATIISGPAVYTATFGVNTHTFAPFFWNGTSNLVIQACHDNTNVLSMNVDMQTISNRTLYSAVAGACAQTSGTSVAYRPVIRFGAQVGTQSAGTLNWQWNPGAVNSNTTTVSPTTTGTSIMPSYTVTAIDPATTCSNTAVVTITVNPVPTVSVAASTGSICSGTTASLTATGANTYSWLPAGGTSSVAVVSPATSTVYTVTGTSLGCSNTQTVSLNVTPTPTVVASASPSVICAGATLTLTASGASTYSWMPNSSASGTVTATPTVSTIYTVTGTTAGCSNTKTVSTTVNAVPTLTVTSNPASGALCTTGATATLTATGTSTAYVWSTTANTASTSVAPTVTTTYTVTGTNSCGTKTATTTIAVATTPTITATSSSTLSCAGNSVALTANATPGVTYLWSTGPGTPSITVSPSVTTTYTVTGTNACGTATATIVQNVSPCVGIEEVTEGNAISIYPNPANDYVNIAIPASLTSGNTMVEVTDALGKLVMKETLNTDVTTLNTNKLEDGIYFFKVITNNQTIKVGKVVKH